MPANLTNIREKGVDLSDQYVSLNDLDNVDSFLNFAGQDLYYISGGLWVWGRNTKGQLGYGTTATEATDPTQVGSLTNWKQTSSGYWSYTLAVKSDGTLWGWGSNGRGQLGLSDENPRSSPVQVGSLTNWKQVSAGSGSSDGVASAIKTDGSLWTWGENYRGALGLNNTTRQNSPVQVGTLTNWKQVVSGYMNIAAVKQDGTLWTWGNNEYGQLGVGDRTHRSSPVQVGTLTNWKSIGTMGQLCLALKTDNSLWAWGYNSGGQLGLGDLTHRSSPVQVGSLTNWKSLAYGIAVKTDGTLWTWGTNAYGELGLGDRTSYSSPTQVGTLTNWKTTFLVTGSRSFAIKTDGTLWGWGHNYGNIFPQRYSSPVQVGSLTTWKSISGGVNHVVAIK